MAKDSKELERQFNSSDRLVSEFLDENSQYAWVSSGKFFERQQYLFQKLEKKPKKLVVIFSKRIMRKFVKYANKSRRSV